MLLVEQAHHQRLFDPGKSAIGHGDGRGDTQRLGRQAAFAEELVVAKNGDDSFLAML